MTGFYGIIDGGKTAMIGIAACAGLPLVGDRLRPDLALTMDNLTPFMAFYETACPRAKP